VLGELRASIVAERVEEAVVAAADDVEQVARKR